MEDWLKCQMRSLVKYRQNQHQTVCNNENIEFDSIDTSLYTTAKHIIKEACLSIF